MTTTWNFDTAHSSVGFTVRHMVIAKVHGVFAQWSGAIELDEGDFTKSRVAVEIDAASIDTKNAQRDGHLRSADFFDAEKFPKLTFRSTRIEKTGADRFKVFGDLTMHGVTKAVVLDAEDTGAGKDPWGNERRGFSASATVDRREFGLNWNQALEAGGVLVSEQVRIQLDLSSVKQKTAAAG
jgi:polyisoprenoid-binding protein YceI